MNVKRIIPMLLLLSVSLFAQSASPDQAKPKQKAAAEASSATADLANEVHELRRMMETQQQQIQQLQQAVESRDQQIADLQNAASQARQSAESAVSSSSQSAQMVGWLQGSVADIKAANTNVATTMQEEQKRIAEMIEHPLAIHYKGITISPGGFLAAESVWRQHAMASDVNTPFNSVPFTGADASHLTEFFGSGRQSRITLLAEGKLSSAKLSGYYETDWLSSGITSTATESNSYTNRMRQLWGQAALDSGWTFTGGQMWSLVTETKKGLDNRTEATPMTIDAQYAVGFSWARQYGFRVTKNFDNKFWLGASIENPEVTLSFRNNLAANFVVGNIGTSGGLYNPVGTYSYNASPDFVVKAALEPGFGHYEVFGIISTFRDRVYPLGDTSVSACGVAAPIPAGTLPCNSTRTGGGGGANARWSFFDKHVDFGIHFLGGDGVGRYGTSTLPDVTIHPNSTLEPIRAYQGLGTLEYHSKSWDVYLNAGAEYAQRTVYPITVGTTTSLVGYGPGNGNTTACNTEATPSSPSSGIYPPNSTGFNPASGSCPVDTRDVIEGTVGFWYKPYSGPKGRIQFGPEYEYIVRNVWGCSIHSIGITCAATSAFNPHAVENIFMTSFRYYLP